MCLGQSLCPRHHLCSRLCPSEGQAFQRLQGGFHHPLLCPTSLPTVLPVPVSAKQAPYTLTHMHPHTHTYILTHRHSQSHTHIHTHAHTHTLTYSHRHTFTHTLTHSHTPTYTLTRMHTHLHTHSHRHTLTHTSLLRALPPPLPLVNHVTFLRQRNSISESEGAQLGSGNPARGSDTRTPETCPWEPLCKELMQGVSCSPRQPHCRGQRPAEQ